MKCRDHLQPDNVYKLPALFTSSDSCFLCFFIAAARGFAPPPNMGTAPVGSWRENTQFKIEIYMYSCTQVYSINHNFHISKCTGICAQIHGDPHL